MARRRPSRRFQTSYVSVLLYCWSAAAVAVAKEEVAVAVAAAAAAAAVVVEVEGWPVVRRLWYHPRVDEL